MLTLPLKSGMSVFGSNALPMAFLIVSMMNVDVVRLL
jgi:hypothetical protein